MAAFENLTIRVPSELASAIRQTVAGGDYASPSEVVREALLDWTRSRENGGGGVEALRIAIREGLESGPGIPAEEVFAEWRERYSETT